MKRRGFLGIMGGAVVAGPGAAKQAATRSMGSGAMGQISALGSPSYSNHTGEAMIKGATLDHKNYMMLRAEELRRRISGELTEEELEERRVQNGRRSARFEIETGSLRSMAETHKYARMARFIEAQDHERERFYARRSLAEVLKELAGMGS